MQGIHNNQINFSGAYIVKGTAKAVNRFENELNRVLLNKRNSDVLTMPLTDVYHDDQPYMEILVCTDTHSNNLKTYLQQKAKLQEKKIKRFVNDFKTWDSAKQKMWVSNLQKAVALANENEQKVTAPGEISLQNGNPDSFLNWYRAMVKEANTLYKKISGLGNLPFPAKIRRLDADKTFVALVDDNFNIQEGFIRGKSNKIDIEIVGNQEYRYKNNKFHEVITYKTDFPEENVIESSNRFYYDKNGKLQRVVSRNSDGKIIGIQRVNKQKNSFDKCY